MNKDEMTEEEINKKAEKHCNEVLCNAHEKCYEVIKCRDWRSRRAGFFCGYEQALKDFEKENAELEKVKQVKIEVTRDYKKLAKDLQEQGNQLTKAKELLKQWVEYYKPKLEGYPITPIQEQTEQFINEVEK